MAQASKKKPAAKKKASGKKTAATKASVKKAATKKVVAKKTKRKANPALMKPMQPSELLAEIVGNKAQPRGQITKGVWAYIKKHGLQDKTNKRMINADEKLKKLFGGKSTVNMFEMTKLVSKHIS